MMSIQNLHNNRKFELEIKMDNNIIVDSIKKLCKDKNITVSQLEKETGLSQGLVSKWMNTTPSLDKIVDIADYFHTSIDEVVGYNQSLNDEFLNKLYHQTEEKLISWKLVTNNSTTEYPNIKLFDVGTDEYQLYDEEEYGQKHYAAKYNGGYIIMYSFYKYDFLLKPVSVRMFIQPTQESYLVEQHYPENTLTKLWIKILNSLGNDAPDEVKVEEFKNNFILNNSKLNSRSTISKKTNLSDMQELMSKPEIIKLMELCNQPAFRELRETFNSPEIQSAIQIANKLQSYFDE